MANLKEIIEGHAFLSGLEPNQLSWLAQTARESHFAAGEVIAKEGAEADHFHLIVSGKVEIEGFIPDRGQVGFQTIAAGDALGWSWLFPPFKWHFTAKAVEDTSAVTWDTALLRARTEEDPKFGFDLASRMTNLLLGRLKATRDQLLRYYQI